MPMRLSMSSITAPTADSTAEFDGTISTTGSPR
jgi:hypothetical protein